MEYNFDIFNDVGPVESHDRLIINTTKIMQYIDPVAFVDIFELQKNSTHFGARFKDCEADTLLHLDN
jgi:hypothetical protein